MGYGLYDRRNPRYVCRIENGEVVCYVNYEGTVYGNYSGGGSYASYDTKVNAPNGQKPKSIVIC